MQLPLMNSAKRIEYALEKDFFAIIGEFVGTLMFLWLTFAGVSFANHTNESGDPSNLSRVLFIAFVFGFSAMINIWIFYDASGGLFNPAITFSLMLAGKVPFFRGLSMIIAEFAAGLTAAGLVQVMFPKNLHADVQLAPGTSATQGLFIETVLTAQLILAVLLIKSNKSTASRLAPTGIGLALFVDVLAGYYYTGASVNPARALGPAVVRNVYPNYFWVYFVGPFLGTILASGIFGLLQLLQGSLEENKEQMRKEEQETYAEEAKEPLNRSGLDIKF
jgi:aquaporin related protein